MTTKGAAAPDWDELAPFWHLFETAGTDRSITSMLLAQLRAPVLYLGGGRGTYAALLRHRLGETVVDASRAMARRCRQDFDLACVQADMRRLPFTDLSFASAYCATGVLEYLGDADRVCALEELSRVVTTQGAIMMSAFTPVGADTQPVEGCFAALETWRCDDGPREVRPRISFAFDGVARELGDRSTAYRLLRAILPPIDPVVGVDDIAAMAAAASLTVKSVSRRSERGVATWHLIRELGAVLKATS
jgi:ubiquinone/menaquinone biosynthesis C-methylase UbiE